MVREDVQLGFVERAVVNFGSGDVVDVEGVGGNVDGGRYGVVVCGSDGSVNEGVLGVENRDGSRGSKDKINSGLGVSEAFVFRSGPLAGVGMLYTKKVTKVRRVVSVGGEKLVVKPGPGFRVFDVVTVKSGLEMSVHVAGKNVAGFLLLELRDNVSESLLVRNDVSLVDIEKA